MSVEKLKEKLKKGEILPIYLFYGDEDYLKNYYFDELQKKILGGNKDFNFTVFEGKDLELQELSDALESYPLMSDKKLIVIKNLNITEQSEIKEYITENIKSLPDFSVLLIYEDIIELDDKKDAKAISFINLINKTGLSVNFRKAEEKDLVNWADRHIKSRGYKADLSTIRYMLSVCDNSMNVLINEIEKLCGYANDFEITKKDIDDIVTRTIDSRIFDLTDAIAGRDYSKAFSVLDELFFLKYTDTVIAGSIYRAFINLYNIKMASMQGIQAYEAAKDLGLKDFVASKYRRFCENMSEEFLRNCLYKCEKADIDLKSSYSEKRVIIERLIGEIINIDIKDK